MKFRKNRIAIADNDSNVLFYIFIAVTGCVLLPISIFIQILLLLQKKYVGLVIADSILIFLLLIVLGYFILKCVFSTVTLKNEVVTLNDMIFFSKNLSYDDITKIEVNPYSKTNPLLNDLWGKYIFVYGKDDQIIFKFAYDELAYNMLLKKINKENQKTTVDNNENQYDQYYQKMSENNSIERFK